ncbi:MAG: HAD hydrolase family protein [Phycisphaerae bacterium]|nr:HAD hydrolase family protein [Phycisphaerae bacterium]
MVSGEIRLLILDVDGVLTDGTILFGDAGGQYRRFHIRDGLGIAMWRAVGRTVAILTSKRSEAVLARAKMLGIDLVEQGAEDKLPALERILGVTGVPASDTAYMGDDLLDLAVMRGVEYPITVADGAEAVKAVARHVTQRSGGQGAVREAIEHLLCREGLWEAALRAIGADRGAG